jgi:hypothetical protein
VEEVRKTEPVTPPVSVKKRNPYSVENVTKALNNVAARSGGRIQVVVPSPTHNYVRFEPQNLNQIMLLQDLGYDLWDEPLDEEGSGSNLRQATLADSLNYFYTLIPENYSIIQTVPYSVLGQVILFDEDAGDEQDPEDPWIPDPENCPDPNNPNCPCYEGPCARTSGGELVDLREDLVKKTTKYLLDAGVDLVELYNEMMELAGYPDEKYEKDASGRIQAQRYYPAGRIMVRDNSINQDVPVRNTFIKSRRFMKLAHTYTDASGYFRINKGYRNKARVIVKFKNPRVKIRGVSGVLKIWEWTHPVKAKLDLYERTAMENITHTFQYTTNANTRQAMQFTAAHVINAVYDIDQYCAANNINTMPDKTNLWVTTADFFNSSSAPMLYQILESERTKFWVKLFLKPPKNVTDAVIKTLKGILIHYAPDVVITINNDSQNGPARVAHDISGTAFHELGHAVHYKKVGKSYWVDVIEHYFSNFINTGTAYGNKNNLTAVVESWGYFIGPTFTRTKYGALNATIIANDQRDFLEYQKNDNSVPWAPFNGSFSRGWIPWGMHHDLIDTGEPSVTLITDQVNGYTINGIFKGFHSGSTTVQNLKSAILANNANSQAAQVNTLVTGYGW